MKILLYILSIIILSFSLSYAQTDRKFDIVSTYVYSIKGKTATGVKTTQIKEPFIAISRDLLIKYPLHSYVQITKCRWEGTYKVMDIMNARYISTIDIFYKGKNKFNKEECLCSKLPETTNPVLDQMSKT